MPWRTGVGYCLSTRNKPGKEGAERKQQMTESSAHLTPTPYLFRSKLGKRGATSECSFSHHHAVTSHENGHGEERAEGLVPGSSCREGMKKQEGRAVRPQCY